MVKGAKGAKKRKTRESWGRVRQLPSKRWQASYTGPDLAVHKAPATFVTMSDARAWLAAEQGMISTGSWIRPDARSKFVATYTVAQYAELWLAGRELKPRTRALYQSIIGAKIAPSALGTLLLPEVTAAAVRAWYATLNPEQATARAHAYALLKTIMGTAVDDELIKVNPCRIRGAGVTKRERKIKAATIGELAAISERLPERYRVMVLLSAWCALRFGEVTELRRRDLDGDVLHVARAVTVVKGEQIVGTPKSAAGDRRVTVPEKLMPMLADHIERFAQQGSDGLIFPAEMSGRQLTHGTFYKTWDRARTAAGRPDLRFHDLRHTGAVLAAATGATLAELMARLGHSTVGAAMRYQHAAADRDRVIADALSKLMG